MEKKVILMDKIPPATIPRPDFTASPFTPGPAGHWPSGIILPKSMNK
jgi:hypothetical protein